MRARAVVNQMSEKEKTKMSWGGTPLRAGQYAQAGYGGRCGNAMRSRGRSYGRPGRPGGKGLAGGAKTVGGAIPLP